MYDSGARQARGEVLVFTESHCVANAECLEEFVRYFDNHPDEAACCNSDGINRNYIARMEERMCQEEFARRLRDDPWNKVTIRGFAIRRDAYQEVGGFDHGLGHFAEPVLAKNIHARDYRVGYAKQAKVKHANQTTCSGLQADLVQYGRGEIRYWLQNRHDVDQDLIGASDAWTSREKWRPSAARQRCATVVRNLASGVFSMSTALSRAHFRFLAENVVPSLIRIRWNIARMKLELFRSRLRIRRSQRDEDKMFAAFRIHWNQCIELGRLLEIREHLQSQPNAGQQPMVYDISRPAGVNYCGYYPPEQDESGAFRWSEPVSAVVVSPPVGSYEVAIETVSLRPDLKVAIYLDHHRVPAVTLDHQANKIRFPVDISALPPDDGSHELVLICEPLASQRKRPADPRVLGLPVRRISFSTAPTARRTAA